LLFIAAAEESMIANFCCGKDFATVSVASAMRKPTATTRSYFWRASDERLGT
jgi:hypothetical protein